MMVLHCIISEIYFTLVRNVTTIIHNVTMNHQQHTERDSYKFRNGICTRLSKVFVPACTVRVLCTTCETTDAYIRTVVTFV
jgi:hypothetical protein